ncbi:hypothetical protein ZIOFF_001487 [Zingiber officinale]|uniref:Uncharacterized protein n=1 Tax=Zingiber officinale TaxID=94328 RepID=A0A8J5LYH9_ZINOF|nr:hypothetical protein ZIOFF_001487 [Zingiber officinale]
MASLLNPSFFLPALPPFIHYICYSPCFSRFFLRSPAEMVLPNDIDLLNPPAELEKRRHKLKRLVQSPNSFFMVQMLNAKGVSTFMSFFFLDFTFQKFLFDGYFAEPLCSATLRQSWCVAIARPCSASRPAGVPGSQRAAPSDGRVIELIYNFSLMVEEVHILVSSAYWPICLFPEGFDGTCLFAPKDMKPATGTEETGLVRKLNGALRIDFQANIGYEEILADL